MGATHYLDWAKQVLQIEAQSVLEMAAQLDGAFARAVDAVLQSRGRVIVTGMGQIGAYRAQNRRHAGLHRHAGLFCPSGRSGARRFGHDCGRRRGAGHFQFWRKR